MCIVVYKYENRCLAEEENVHGMSINLINYWIFNHEELTPYGSIF